jgi:hypothetical protein
MAGKFSLARTPIYDAHGNMNRQWVLFFSGLGTATGEAITLTVIAGIATPDLSLGTRFLLVLTADTTLALPIGSPSAPTDWVLIVQQDSTGGWSLFTPDYPMNYALATAQSPADTESVQSFTTDATTTRGAGAPSVDQPIP